MIFTNQILTDQEIKVIEQIDRIRKNLKYAISEPSPRWHGFLRRSAFARAIRGSNSIEGFNVTAEDALAAVDGEEPTDAAQEAWEAVKGYRNAMTYVLQLATDEHFSYSDGLLRSLHYMMLQYDLSKHPGRWRPGPVYVNDEKKKEIVYEGPDAEMVPGLMKELVDSLNAPNHFPAMARAAMSHLNLTMIHPFSDGNGRMARCLQTLVLAREGILSPEFCSIEEYLGAETDAYYDVLVDVGRGAWHPQNDARPWMQFCLTAHFRQASTLLRRSKETKRVWDLLEVEVNRHGLPDRMVGALVNAAFGLRIKNSNYRIAADVSENVASRDLKELVDSGLLIASGERRGRYYEASTPIRAIRERSREPKEKIDPFIQESLRFQGM